MNAATVRRRTNLHTVRVIFQIFSFLLNAVMQVFGFVPEDCVIWFMPSAAEQIFKQAA